MASTRWEPKANAVAQVDTITVAGTWLATETITLTINTKTLVITIGSLVTPTQVAATIVEAWQSSTLTDTTASVAPSGGGTGITEFAEITATSEAAVVTLTHDTPGVPFTLAESETSTSGTLTLLSDGTGASVLATGPNHWDDNDNWSEGMFPGAADAVYIDNSDVDILYGLGQSAINIASLTIAASYTGNIGLPKTNEAGYVEYRADYLAIRATVIDIGGGEGSGSGRIKLDNDILTATMTVHSTGAPAEFGVESVLFKATGSNTSVSVYSGSVGIASFGGEVATVETLLVTSGTVKCGAGCTLDTITNQSGDTTFEDNAVTVTNGTGVMTIAGTATVTTLNVDGGVVNYLSNGTITTANVGGKGVNGTLDSSRDMRARTITTTNLRQNGIIFDPLKTITHTNGIAPGSEVQSISAT